VLLVALVVVAVASMVFLSVLKSANAQRQRLQTELWRVQAAWLAESGLERAAARLATQPDYPGESWSVPAEQLGGPLAAAVRIRVEAAPAKAKDRVVRVEADYPDHPQDRVRESRQTVIRVP